MSKHTNVADLARRRMQREAAKGLRPKDDGKPLTGVMVGREGDRVSLRFAQACTSILFGPKEALMLADALKNSVAKMELAPTPAPEIEP